MNKKLTAALLMVLSSIIAVYFLWKYPTLLIATLIFLSFVKNKLSPIKKEFAMFVVSAFVGTFGEFVVMYAGPWAYAEPSLINFPIWLPFLWGLAGITGITIYHLIVER